MTTFYRHQIVLNTTTLELGHVQTDPFPGIGRQSVPVVINDLRVYGKPGHNVKSMPAIDLLSLGFDWGAAWRKLADLRDSGAYALTDPRIPPRQPVITESAAD